MHPEGFPEDFNITQSPHQSFKIKKDSNLKVVNEMSEFVSESELDGPYFNQNNVELHCFVKIGEILSKVLTKRDELIKFHTEFSTQEQEFKKQCGVNKNINFMSDDEKERYKCFVKLNSIRELIQEAINK